MVHLCTTHVQRHRGTTVYHTYNVVQHNLLVAEVLAGLATDTTVHLRRRGVNKLTFTIRASSRHPGLPGRPVFPITPRLSSTCPSQDATENFRRNHSRLASFVVRGNLAHKKTPAPRTLQQDYTSGPSVFLGEGAVSYERGTPEGLRGSRAPTSPRERRHPGVPRS